MEGIAVLEKYFPIKDVNDLVKIFKYEAEKVNPKLAYLSIILGWFENQLTQQKNKTASYKDIFPIYEWHDFNKLCEEYHNLVVSKFPNPDILRELDEQAAIKEVSDFIWHHLSKAFFKDKFHIQSVFSFLTVKQLDCFGIAIATLATLQELGFNDVHLALSEDHAWLTYGENNTAEVTWHGKGNENKRGKPIEYGCDVEIKYNWLYLGGRSINCTRHMEMVAIINALNPGINSKMDSEIIGNIQQNLLWLMFNVGYLDKFPMAVCNIADLEEISPSKDRKYTIEQLYTKAIDISQTCYQNCHVYPYTYYAGYLYRVKEFEKAIVIWTEAAKVMSRYNYSKEDEEIYKEFSEITNTFLPNIVKIKPEIFQIEETLSLILQYFDYLCTWESGSKTPVFHEEWAKSFIKICSAVPANVKMDCLKRLKHCAEEEEKEAAHTGEVDDIQHCAEEEEKEATHTGGVDDIQHCAEEEEKEAAHTGEVDDIQHCAEEEEKEAAHTGEVEDIQNTASFNAAGGVNNDSFDGIKKEELVKLKIIRSGKMLEIVKILAQSKLNSSAIRLQFCAQTNIYFVKKVKRSVEESVDTPFIKKRRKVR